MDIFVRLSTRDGITGGRFNCYFFLSFLIQDFSRSLGRFHLLKLHLACLPIQSHWLTCCLCITPRPNSNQYAAVAEVRPRRSMRREPSSMETCMGYLTVRKVAQHTSDQFWRVTAFTEFIPPDIWNMRAMIFPLSAPRCRITELDSHFKYQCSVFRL